MLHACFWFLLDYRKKSQVILPPLHQYVMFVQFIHPFPYPVTHYPLWLYLASFYQQTSFLNLFFLFSFHLLIFSGIAGNHPLRGLNDDEMGPRFPAVSDAYDGELQDIIIKCGEKLGLQVQYNSLFLFFFLSQFINFLFFFITTSLF